MKLEPFEYLFLTDATTSLNIMFKFQLAACKPRPADKLEEFAERKPRPADKFEEFAERKPRPAGNVEFAECKPWTPRPAGLKSVSISSLAIDMASDNEKLTKCCCILLLMRPLYLLVTGWKALPVLFEVKQLAECRSRAADKLVVLAECKPLMYLAINLGNPLPFELDTASC